MGGVIEKESSLLVASERTFREQFNVDCRVNCEAIKISPKQSLMGGDFDNTDIMRLNLIDDYTPSLTDTTEPNTIALDLKAKDRSLSYDRIRVVLDKATHMPLREELFTLSGRMIKRMTFEQPRDYHGHRRPAILKMENLLSGKTATVIELLDMEPNKTLPEAKFSYDALNR